MSQDQVPATVSVVLAVLNGADTIGTQLAAIAQQSFRGQFEVIVADNGSTDDTQAVVRQFIGRLPDLRIIDASQQRGKAYAANAGARISNGDLLLFLDADDEIAPGYIEAMIAALKDDDLVGGSLDTEALAAPWGGGQGVARAGAMVADFLPAAGGGCIGVRREAFDAVGGFDPTMRWGEDVDFCWRVQLAAFSFKPAHSAVVRYRARSSFRGVFHQARTRGFSGPLLYSRHRRNGMPRRPLHGTMRFYVGPLLQIARSRSKADLARCAYLIGFRVGRLQGCLRSKVVYL